MNQNPLLGLHYLSEGFKLIFKKGLRRFVVIPLIINTLLFTGMFFLSKYYFKVFDHWIAAHLPHWLIWLASILWVIFFIGFILLFIYSFTTLANLVSAPFNSFLAEKVEFYLTGKKIPERSLLEITKDVPRVIGRQLAIIGYYLPRAVLLLILFFIPIIQLVAGILWFVFNAWVMSLQYLDYPTDNHQIPLSDVKAWMGRNRLLALGFGTGVLLISMIPILNFFIVPAAVAGATQCWIKENILT